MRAPNAKAVLSESSFPKRKNQFKNFTLSVKDKKTFYEPDVPTVPLKLAGELRTEDNDELRNYLFQSFSPIYNVQVCNNGKEALTIVKQFWPELILSDIMMPEMRGDELCTAIKERHRNFPYPDTTADGTGR